MYRCTAKARKWDIRVYDLIIKIAITSWSSRENDKNKTVFMGTKFYKKMVFSAFEFIYRNEYRNINIYFLWDPNIVYPVPMSVTH